MRKPIPNVDYFVYFMPMHGSIGGFVTPNPDGTFSVYLNSRLSRERNAKSLKHELNHIINLDFTKYDVSKIEKL